MPRVARFAILFIDDLDRCRPEFAIRFLEQTKAIFQLPNVIIVYSTDIVQLSRSLEGSMVLIFWQGLSRTFL
ncbi:MAG: P-loop NTPase fold protein [Collinsella sp.]